MAFNSFLSTSKKRPFPLQRAQDSAKNENMVGILFVMTVDPKIKSIPFADIEEYSYFKTEAEVLFSMHSIFRIGEIRALGAGQRLFEVQLTLTSDDDPQLRRLTDCIDEEIGGGTGWHRLGRVLLKMEQVNKAEELYLTLLEQKPSQSDQGVYYHQLGLIKDRQGDYKEAVRYYEQALSIQEKILSPTDPELATSYNNIGEVYRNMGEYSKALSYYEKALDIDQKTLPANHPDLATSYNNIGSVYYHLKEYPKAKSYFQKALDIRQRSLPPNHPNIQSVT